MEIEIDEPDRIESDDFFMDHMEEPAHLWPFFFRFYPSFVVDGRTCSTIVVNLVNLVNLVRLHERYLARRLGREGLRSRASADKDT